MVYLFSLIKDHVFDVHNFTARAGIFFLILLTVVCAVSSYGIMSFLEFWKMSGQQFFFNPFLSPIFSVLSS